jgi:hypothetical protein
MKPPERRDTRVSIRVTAIRQSGGTSHQHIVHLWWTNPSTGTIGDNSRAEIVDWLENRGGDAYVQEAGRRADVEVRSPDYGPRYLQTRADGVWSDNLLALPRR